MAPKLDVKVKGPDLKFLEAAVPSIDSGNARHVAKTGDDNNLGKTRDDAWLTIKHAVSKLEPGQVLYVHPGEYEEKKIYTTIHGEVAKPIRVVGLPGAVIYGKNQSDSNNFIEIKHNYWTIERLEIDAGNKAGFAVYFNNCQYAMIRNLHIHHCKMGAAVTLVGAKDIAILDNVIHHTVKPDHDGHGILVQSNSANILIKENRSWQNSGDSIQCEKTEHGVNPPTDIIIEDNRFYEDQENAVDLKYCKNVIVQRNKFYGYKGRRATSKQGAAIVVHVNASNILFQHNRIWNCGLGASIGSKENGPANNIVFRRNLVFNMRIEPSLDKGVPIPGDFTPGVAVRVSPCNRIEIYNNTFYNLDGDGIVLGDTDVVQEVELLNNIVMNCNHYISIVTSNVPSLTSDRNIYWDNRSTDPKSEKMRVNGTPTDFDKWKQPQGPDASSKVADPQFIANPEYNDFYSQSLDVRDKAIRILLDKGQICGSGPDIGFLENCP